MYESPRELEEEQEEEQEEEISLADLFPDPADFVPASPTFTFPPLPPSPPDGEVQIQIQIFLANLQNIFSNFNKIFSGPGDGDGVYRADRDRGGPAEQENET